MQIRKVFFILTCTPLGQEYTLQKACSPVTNSKTCFIKHGIQKEGFHFRATGLVPEV